MADAPKETNAEKIARLQEEIQLKKLEAEQAKLTKTPPVKAAKEAVREGASKVGPALAKGGKIAGSFIAKEAGYGNKVKNPITGRMETPPSAIEKGLERLADIAGWFGKKAKIAAASRPQEKIEARMTDAEKSQKILADIERQKVAKAKITEQAKTQRLNTPSPNLAVGPDQKVVVSKRGVQAIVPKSTPDIVVRDPLEARVNNYIARLHDFIGRESPMLSDPNATTVKQGALIGARNKIQKMAGSAFAEDFLVAGLNKSGMFTADEVPLVASRLKNRLETRAMLEKSGLFDGIDRPKSMLSGGAPIPLDRSSKKTAIVDDFGNEVQVTPQGRTQWASQAEEPDLQKRLKRFKDTKDSRAMAAIAAEEAKLQAARDAVAPYGGQRPSGPNTPSNITVLRNEIETNRRAVAVAREAESTRAAVARFDTAKRIEDARKRLESMREAERQQLIQFFQLRSPAGNDSAWTGTRWSSNSGPFVGSSPSGVTRQDRLREISKQNAQGVTMDEVMLQKWLKARDATSTTSSKAKARPVEPLKRSIQGDPSRLRPTITFNGTILPAIGGLAASVGSAAGQTAKGLEVMGMDFIDQKKAEMILKNVPSDQWGEHEFEVVGRYYANQRAKETGFDPTARQTEATRRGIAEPMQYNPMFAGGL